MQLFDLSNTPEGEQLAHANEDKLQNLNFKLENVKKQDLLLLSRRPLNARREVDIKS